MKLRIFHFAILGLLLYLPQASASGIVTIFAASSTRSAIDTIVDACPGLAGIRCRASYSASSSIARQIAAGAPADIFVSANRQWMRYLSEWNLITPDSVRVVASNSLVAITSADADVGILDEQALLRWLENDRIAVGDPEHVPAGVYAMEALMTMGLWQSVRQRTLRMPNVRAALAVVARKEADTGIVYATDAMISARVKVIYEFDIATHDTIRYPVGLVNGRTNDDVRRVFDLIIGDFGRKAFQSAGFRRPPES